MFWMEKSNDGIWARAGSASEVDAFMTAARLRRFADEFRRQGGALNFGGAAVGNFVFTGSFLEQRRDFNAAVELHRFLDSIQEASAQGREVTV